MVMRSYLAAFTTHPPFDAFNKNPVYLCPAHRTGLFRYCLRFRLNQTM